MASTKGGDEEDLAVFMLRNRTAFEKLPHGGGLNEEPTGTIQGTPLLFCRNDSQGYHHRTIAGVFDTRIYTTGIL